METSKSFLSFQTGSFGDRFDREGGSVGSEDSVFGSEFVETTEETLLDAEVFYDGFDNQVGFGYGGGGVGSRGDVSESSIEEGFLVGFRGGVELAGYSSERFGDDGSAVVESSVGDIRHD